MLLFSCFFYKRGRTTLSKAVEVVGWLTTPCLWGHQAPKNGPRSRGVPKHPRGSQWLTLSLHMGGGRGEAAARRRPSLLLHRLFKGSKCSRVDCNGETCSDFSMSTLNWG